MLMLYDFACVCVNKTTEKCTYVRTYIRGVRPTHTAPTTAGSKLLVLIKYLCDSLHIR